MEKFIYEYIAGNPYEGTWSVYIGIEYSDKESLIKDLTECVQQFDSRRKETLIAIKGLNEKSSKLLDKIRNNKQEEHLETYRELNKKVRNLENELRHIVFNGKQYPTDIFYDTYYESGTEKVCDFKTRIKSLEEFFEGVKL